MGERSLLVVAVVVLVIASFVSFRSLHQVSFVQDTSLLTGYATFPQLGNGVVQMQNAQNPRQGSCKNYPIGSCQTNSQGASYYYACIKGKVYKEVCSNGCAYVQDSAGNSVATCIGQCGQCDPTNFKKQCDPPQSASATNYLTCVKCDAGEKPPAGQPPFKIKSNPCPKDCVCYNGMCLCDEKQTVQEGV